MVTVENKRDHHKLPVMYLRGFTEPGTSFVWVYKQGRPYSPGPKAGRDNPARLGIYVTAVERDRNTVTRFDGRRDFNTVEDEHQKIESRAAWALRTIRKQQPVSVLAKESLARFIGALWRRTDHRRNVAGPILEAELKRREAEARALADAGNFGLAWHFLRAIEYMRTDEGQKYTYVGTETQPLPQMHKAFLEMRWSFAVAPDGTTFVTSDSPVIFSLSDGLQNSPLVLPISRDVALIATWESVQDLQYGPIRAEQVSSIDQVVVRAALDELYGSQPDESFVAQFNSRKPNA
jgi:hypothetical protein